CLDDRPVGWSGPVFHSRTEWVKRRQCRGVPERRRRRRASRPPAPAQSRATPGTAGPGPPVLGRVSDPAVARAAWTPATTEERAIGYGIATGAVPGPPAPQESQVWLRGLAPTDGCDQSQTPAGKIARTWASWAAVAEAG